MIKPFHIILFICDIYFGFQSWLHKTVLVSEFLYISRHIFVTFFYIPYYHTYQLLHKLVVSSSSRGRWFDWFKFDLVVQKNNLDMHTWLLGILKVFSAWPISLITNNSHNLEEWFTEGRRSLHFKTYATDVGRCFRSDNNKWGFGRWTSFPNLFSVLKFTDNWYSE